MCWCPARKEDASDRQVSRDIGIKVTTRSPTLTTHVIDPMVDESRQFVLENLLFRFRISDFGFTRA